MSIWRAKWAREAQEQRPLMKVTCQHPGCEYVVLSTDPELTKIHHVASCHFGHPHRFKVVRWKEAEGAKP